MNKTLDSAHLIEGLSLSYPEILQTVSAKSPEAAANAPPFIENVFTLGWCHYVTLLTIDNAEARRFYEIEATDNGWSVRELEPQIASSPYERLALSPDKAALRQLAREGPVAENADDLIKNDV